MKQKENQMSDEDFANDRNINCGCIVILFAMLIFAYGVYEFFF